MQGASPSSRQQSVDTASHRTTDPRVPRREFRLLLEGMHAWLSQLTGGPGPSRCVGILRGDDGCGQAETFEAFRDFCHHIGLQALCARSVCDSPSPGVVGDLMRQLVDLETIRKGQASEQSDDGDGPDAGLSTSVASELSRVTVDLSSESVPLPSLGFELDNLRLVDAVARALFEASASTAMVVIVQDFENMDVFSRRVFDHLLRMLALRRQRRRMPRMLLVIGMPDGCSVEGFDDAFWRNFDSLTSFEVVARGYSRSDLDGLARHVLEQDLPVGTRESVMRSCGGHVRTIQWFLRGWSEREDSGDRGDAAVELGDLVRERLERTPPTVRKLIEVLAVLARPVSANLLFEATGFGDEEAAELALELQLESFDSKSVLERLCELGWAIEQRAAGTVTYTEFGIVASDIASTIAESIPSNDRELIDAGAAAALALEAADDPRLWPYALRHLLRTRLPVDVEGTASLAISYLQTLGCLDETIELLDSMVTSTSHDSAAGDVWRLRYARALHASGRHREAIDQYEELRRLVPRGLEKARLHLWIGDLRASLSDGEVCQREYDAGLQCLESVEIEHEAERLRILTAKAKAFHEAGDDIKCRTIFDELRPLLSNEELAEHDAFGAAYTLGQAVEVEWLVEDGASGGEKTFLEQRRRHANFLGYVKALLQSAQFHKASGDWDNAESFLREMQNAAIESGSRHVLAQAHHAFGCFWRERGQLLQALSYFRHSADTLRDLGDDEALDEVRSLVVVCELQAGQFSAVGATARELVEHWCRRSVRVEASEQPHDAAVRQREITSLRKKISRGRIKLSERFAYAKLLDDSGELSEARDVYWQVCRSATRDVGSVEGGRLRARSLMRMGRIDALTGDYDSSLNRIEQGLSGIGRVPERMIVLQAYREATGVLVEHADFASAHTYALRGFRIALESGEASALALALLALAEYFGGIGAAAAALSVARSALALNAGASNRELELAARRVIVRMAESGGECDSAQQELGLAERCCSLLGQPVERCGLLLERGWLQFHAGEFAAAITSARQGIDIARVCQLRPLLGDLLHLLGSIEASGRNPHRNFVRAIDALEQALHGAESRCRPRLQWEVLSTLAVVYADRGKDDASRRYQERAAAITATIKGQLSPALQEQFGWCSRVAHSRVHNTSATAR